MKERALIGCRFGNNFIVTKDNPNLIVTRVSNLNPQSTVVICESLSTGGKRLIGPFRFIG